MIFFIIHLNQVIILFLVCHSNKVAFGQTRFAAAADSIEHISEEKILLQIFSKMGDRMI